MTRWTWPFEQPNVAGAAYAVMLVVACALVASPRAWQRYLAWAVVVLSALALVLTRSRGGLLGASVGILVLLICSWRWRSGLVIIVGLWLAALLWSPMAARLQRMELWNEDPSLATRFTQWQRGLTVLADRPWGVDDTGFALGALGPPAKHLGTALRSNLNYAMNDVVDLALRAGLPFFCLGLTLLAFLLIPVVSGARRGQVLAQGGLGAALALFTAGQFNPLFCYGHLY